MPKTHLIRPLRNLATTEARTQLPKLVGELVAISEPGETLARLLRYVPHGSDGTPVGGPAVMRVLVGVRWSMRRVSRRG